MRILAVGSRQSGVSYHRLFIPTMYLPKQYAMLTDALTEEELDKGYDIVFINRYVIGHEANDIDNLRKKYGFKLVVDIDDYWHLDVWHMLYSTYPVQRIIDHIKIADVVTCTNQRLYNEIKQLNNNVHILPNALPYGEDQFTIDKTESDLVRFIWAGSATHEKDIAILKRPMQRISADPFIKSKAHFQICGYEPDNTIKTPIWHRMIDNFLSGFNVNGNIREGLPVDLYINFYKEADVSLVPLVESRFNGMKSNLKVLEAATKSLAVICSNVQPYSECPYVIKVYRQSDWFESVKKVCKDAIYRKEMGESNREWCLENFDIRKINIERKQIFESCL